MNVPKESLDPAALAALGLSLALLAWEIWKFAREGGRARVRLVRGIFDDDMLLASKIPANEEQLLGQVGRFSYEVAIIEITNPGRTPMTVEQVSLDYGPYSWKPWKKGRKTASFYPVRFNASMKETRTRIDGLDSATCIFDASHALQRLLRKHGSKKLRVRAEVRVAGRRPRRSSRRSAWVYKPGDRPWVFGRSTFDLSREIYRLLAWRARDKHGVNPLLSDFAMSAAELVESGKTPTMEELRELIPDVQGDLGRQVRTVVYDLAEELASPAGGLLDDSGFAADARRMARSGAVKKARAKSD